MAATPRPWQRGSEHVAPQQGQLFQADQLDLLGEAISIQGHEGVMSFVKRTAQRVFDNDDPQAKIDGIEYGREHAHIGFRSGDNERAYALLV